MSKQSLNISISGGTSAIGSVNQGDRAKVHGSADITQENLDRHSAIAEKAIYDLAREFEKDRVEIQDAIAQLSALRAEIDSGRKDANRAGGILKAVRENFSWAYPAIKDFATAVWPAILVAIGS